jgi:hypothetical protein
MSVNPDSILRGFLMALIVSDEEGNEIVEQTQYENEAEMQEYIENNPEAIPLYQINDELEISIAVQEYNVDGEFIDALAFDQNGGVYILETKLASNADKRKVIAQAFDYGAALWDNQHPNQFINNLDAALEDYDSFQDWAETELELDEEEYEEFKENVFDNLEDGNFSYVIVMDEISDRLKTLVKYLMANSMFDLYGVELEYYKHDGHTIVVPNLHGTEVKKNTQSTKRSSKNTYTDRGKVFDEIQKKFDELIEDEADYTNGNRYRQVRFPDIPNHHHLEWNFGTEDGEKYLQIRMDFEKSNASDHNEELLEYFQENRFSKIKKELDVNEIETSQGRVYAKFFIKKDSTIEEFKESEELQNWAAQKTAKLYTLVKEDLKEKAE